MILHTFISNPPFIGFDLVYRLLHVLPSCLHIQLLPSSERFCAIVTSSVEKGIGSHFSSGKKSVKDRKKNPHKSTLFTWSTLHGCQSLCLWHLYVDMFHLWMKTANPEQLQQRTGFLRQTQVFNIEVHKRAVMCYFLATIVYMGRMKWVENKK